jgi:short-subunit dehydrogenase
VTGRLSASRINSGAAGGIGRAIAKAFAWEGADMALLDRNAAGLEELAATLRATGVAIQTVVADLSTEQGVREGMLAALAPYEGAIDILVPNVGALISGPFGEVSCEQWQQCFAINFFTHVYACRAAATLQAALRLCGWLYSGGGRGGLRRRVRWW